MEQAHESFGHLYRLAVQFTEMLRKRQVDQLRPWLSAAIASSEAQQLAGLNQSGRIMGQNGDN